MQNRANIQIHLYVLVKVYMASAVILGALNSNTSICFS